MRGVSKYNQPHWVGKRFGDLTVLGTGILKSKGNYHFRVECKCGFCFNARAQHVVDQKIRTCIHCRPQSLEKPGFTNSFLSTYKNRAARQGREFYISIDDLQAAFQKQQGLCALTKDTLTLPRNSRERTEFNVSIDRIDSTKGYVPNNIQLVTKRINMCKQDMTQEDFILLCLKVANTKGGSCGV
jgi:hypothetical protein